MSKGTTTGQPVDKQVRPFADFLLEQNKGKTHAELSDALNELAIAVTQTGKAGELTLKIKVKPAAKGDNSTLLVSDQVVAKIPDFDRAGSIFFTTEEGNLTRSDPRQRHLPLGIVGDEDAADDADGAVAQ